MISAQIDILVAISTISIRIDRKCSGIVTYEVQAIFAFIRMFYTRQLCGTYDSLHYFTLDGSTQ